MSCEGMKPRALTVTRLEGNHSTDQIGDGSGQLIQARLALWIREWNVNEVRGAQSRARGAGARLDGVERPPVCLCHNTPNVIEHTVRGTQA